MVRETFVMCIDGNVNVVGSGVIVGRSVSKTEEQVSSVFKNLSETGTFYSADFLSGSGSATESVLFSRATHNGDDVEVRVGVKGILFSYHSIWSGELKESLQRVGFAQTHRQEICDDLCFAKLR